MRRKALALVGAACSVAAFAGCIGSTQPATEIGATQAKLNARGHTDQGPATWWWEYSTSQTALEAGQGLQACGDEPDKRCGPAESAADVNLGTVVKGLAPATTYFFRACGQDQGEGPTCAQTLSFRTKGVRVVRFAGVVTAIAGNSSKYVFAGPTTSVIIEAGDRLTGVASAPLGLMAGRPQTADLGLCYQQGSGTITNFVGANFSAHFFSTTRETYTASSSVVPPQAGAYTVGLCIRNNGNNPINNNNFVNGWIMVSPPQPAPS
jgi:hypothetical protein